MKSRKILEAFSYIDDEWLTLAETGATPHALSLRRSLRLLSSLAAALALILVIGVGAFAFRQFNSLDGDDLALAAHYEGQGIITVEVENRSDVDLDFQSRLKLQRWSTGEEVLRKSDNIVFTGTHIPAGEKGIMRIDISEAYDLSALEVPLVEDCYILTFTNNAFLFGQDWMCSIAFSEPIRIEKETPTPIPPDQADPELVAEIEEELRPYFECYTRDSKEFNSLSAAYLQQCQQLLDKLDGNVVSAITPPALTVKEPEEAVVFDPTVPLDMQLQLTTLNYHITDGYGKLIGSSDMERALVLGALIPQQKGEIDGGAGIPLIYVVTYEISAIKSMQDYAFIRGQLLTFEQMEQYKIYEDAQLVCYNVSSLFYSDLRSYVESMVSQRNDIYFDEQVWLRILNIHDYYNEHIGELLCERE